MKSFEQLLSNHFLLLEELFWSYLFNDPIRTRANKYRKLSLVSPGLVQLCKRIWKGLYPGGGGGLYLIKKPFQNELQQC